MKLLMILFSLSLSAQISPALKTATSYKDIPLNSSIGQCRDKLKLKDMDGKGQYFTINNPEYLKIGEFTFTSGQAAFPFYDKLMNIALTGQWDRQTHQRLLSFLTNQLGKPELRNGWHIWEGTYLLYDLQYDEKRQLSWLNVRYNGEY